MGIEIEGDGAIDLGVGGIISAKYDRVILLLDHTPAQASCLPRNRPFTNPVLKFFNQTQDPAQNMH